MANASEFGISRHATTPPSSIASCVALRLWAVVAPAAGACYLLWRLTHLPAGTVPWLAFPALAAETYVAGLVALFAAMAWRASRAPLQPPSAAHPYTVDVYVLTGDDSSPPLLGATLRAASRLAHPHTTTVLDASASPSSRALAAAYGCAYLESPAPPEDTRDTAHTADSAGLAGRNGAALAAALAATTGEIVLLLCAGQIPDAGLLARSLGAFRDPRVGYVQLRRDPHAPGAGAASPLSSLTVLAQLARGSMGAARFEGAPALARREALLRLGSALQARRGRSRSLHLLAHTLPLVSLPCTTTRAPIRGLQSARPRVRQRFGAATRFSAATSIQRARPRSLRGAPGGRPLAAPPLRHLAAFPLRRRVTTTPPTPPPFGSVAASSLARDLHDAMLTASRALRTGAAPGDALRPLAGVCATAGEELTGLDLAALRRELDLPHDADVARLVCGADGASGFRLTHVRLSPLASLGAARLLAARLADGQAHALHSVAPVPVPLADPALAQSLSLTLHALDLRGVYLPGLALPDLVEWHTPAPAGAVPALAAARLLRAQRRDLSRLPWLPRLAYLAPLYCSLYRLAAVALAAIPVLALCAGPVALGFGPGTFSCLAVYLASALLLVSATARTIPGARALPAELRALAAHGAEAPAARWRIATFVLLLTSVAVGGLRLSLGPSADVPGTFGMAALALAEAWLLWGTLRPLLLPRAQAGAAARPASASSTGRTITSGI